jgi:hypothetical protein
MTKEITITGWDSRDVRFPTSLDKTGSDAMNAAGDYSAAYCILQTDSEFAGHGMVSLILNPSLLFSHQTILPVRMYSLSSETDLESFRHSPSVVETTLSAQPSTTLLIVSGAAPSPPSSKTGVRPGAIWSMTPNCVGLALRRVSSISLSVQ